MEKGQHAPKVRMLMFRVFSCPGSAGASRAGRGGGLLCGLRADGNRVPLSEAVVLRLSWEQMACLSLQGQRFLLDDVEALLFTFRKVFLASLSMKPRNRCGPKQECQNPWLNGVEAGQGDLQAGECTCSPTHR